MGAKKAYQEKMDAQLREWRAKIDLLKVRADKAEAEQRIKYYKMIETLRGKQKAASTKLDELRQSSESAWEDIKTGMEKAWGDLKTAVEEAGRKFK